MVAVEIGNPRGAQAIVGQGRQDANGDEIQPHGLGGAGGGIQELPQIFPHQRQHVAGQRARRGIELDVVLREFCRRQGAGQSGEKGGVGGRGREVRADQPGFQFQPAVNPFLGESTGRHPLPKFLRLPGKPLPESKKVLFGKFRVLDFLAHGAAARRFPIPP
ncbi:MAG TPA: hypothetical protein VNL74_01765 [Methylococcus sp.]|nr:hypothetical protein [Methylococcus sp.]